MGWRSSLASLAGGSAGSTPSRLAMNTTPTPGAATEWAAEKSKEGRRLDSEEMDSILVSRLDMLMHNSMTLSDTSTIELDIFGCFRPWPAVASLQVNVHQCAPLTN